MKKSKVDRAEISKWKDSVIALLISSPEDKVVDLFYWYNTCGVAIVRKNALFMCFLTAEPLNIDIRRQLRIDEKEKFNGKVIRFWQEDGKSYFYDAIEEMPFEPNHLDNLSLQIMSPWEHASLACMIVDRCLQQANFKVIGYDTGLHSPPQIWFRNHDGKLCYILPRGYTKATGIDKSDIEEKDLKLVLERNVIKEEINIYLLYVLMSPDKDESWDPASGPQPTVRTQFINVEKPSVLLNTAILIAQYDAVDGLVLYPGKVIFLNLD